MSNSKSILLAPVALVAATSPVAAQRTSLATGAVFALVLASLAAALFAEAAQPELGYRIICHPSNPITTADRQFVEDAFLRRVTVWTTGEVTRPVDLAPSSPVRRRFTADILRRPVEAVRNYWQRRIFSGSDLPPPEVDTDDDVVTYVLRDRGALGYVSTDAVLKGAKVLTVK